MLRRVGGEGSEGSVGRGAEEWLRDRLQGEVLPEQRAGLAGTDLGDLELFASRDRARAGRDLRPGRCEPSSPRHMGRPASIPTHAERWTWAWFGFDQFAGR